MPGGWRRPARREPRGDRIDAPASGGSAWGSDALVGADAGPLRPTGRPRLRPCERWVTASLRSGRAGHGGTWRVSAVLPNCLSALPLGTRAAHYADALHRG